MAEPNPHHAQLESNGVHFGPDEANAGQNAAYQYWQTDPAGTASSSAREKGNASTTPYPTWRH
jgi:hypothetical protein